MPAFKAVSSVSIEVLRDKPAYLACLRHMGFAGDCLVDLPYDKTSVDFFVLAQALVAALGSEGRPFFVKFDVSIWRNSEDVNLINVFLSNSGFDYDSILRTILTTDEESNKTWATLVFISLIFGWDAILVSRDKKRALVLSHDSLIRVSSIGMVDQIKDIFFG